VSTASPYVFRSLVVSEEYLRSTVRDVIHDTPHIQVIIDSFIQKDYGSYINFIDFLIRNFSNNISNVTITEPTSVKYQNVCGLFKHSEIYEINYYDFMFASFSDMRYTVLNADFYDITYDALSGYGVDNDTIEQVLDTLDILYKYVENYLYYAALSIFSQDEQDIYLVPVKIPERKLLFIKFI